RRSFTSRHLLRRRPLPLRVVARFGLRHLCRFLLLVSKNDGLLLQPGTGEGALLADFRRREHHLLPAALPRARRDAAALRRLSRCLRLLEPCVIDRGLYLDGRVPPLPPRP